MFWRPKFNIALYVLPFILLWPLFYAASWRPRPLAGNDGSAPIDGVTLAIAYGPDGSLVCAPSNGTIQFYVPKEKRWGFFNNPNPSSFPVNVPVQDVPRLKFSADGNTVFAVTGLRSTTSKTQYGPKTIQAFDFNSHKPLYSFGTPSSDVFDISPDGKWAAYASAKGVIVLDLMGTPQTREQSQVRGLGKAFLQDKNFRDYPSRRFALNDTPHALHFSPDSKILAVGFNEQIGLIDVESEAKQPRLQFGILRQSNSGPSYAKNPIWLEWSPDGTKLASYSSTEIAVFDATLKKLVWAPADISYVSNSGINRIIGNIVWEKDGNGFVTGGMQGIRWKFKGGNGSTPLTLEREGTYNSSGAVALSPDEKYLISSRPDSDGYSVWQWRIK